MYIIFDTETTGLPKNWNAPVTDVDNWPRCIQIAWQLHDKDGNLVESKNYLIKPDGFNIPFESEQIHGISTLLAKEQGIDLRDALKEFNEALSRAKFVVGQNVGFDNNVVGCEFHRLQLDSDLLNKPVLDTCTERTAELCKIPGGRGGKFKLPTLTELHTYLFDEPFDEAHNASADVEATARCFLELLRIGNYQTDELLSTEDYLRDFRELHPNRIQRVGLEHQNLKALSKALKEKQAEPDDSLSGVDKQQNLERLKDVPFTHLHNHSQFSVLQSTIRIRNLVQKAGDFGCPALALTDSGNMMAAFHFVSDVEKYNKGLEVEREKAAENGEPFDKQPIKSIVGCEFNVCRDHTNKSEKDNGYRVVLLAKNKRGYLNLAKMSSIAFTKGFYYVPRIDKAVMEQYSEDVICLSGNLSGELSSLILNVGENQAENALNWYKNLYKDDFYIEIIRHGLEEEDAVK